MSISAEITNSDSFPEIPCDWEFVTKQSQEAYSRVFKTLSQAHVHIGIISRVTQHINKDKRDDVSDQAEAMLNELYEKLSANMTVESERLQKILDDHGVNARANYSSPKQVTVHVKSPMDTRYLGILKKLDDIVILLDTLWLFGIFENKQKVQAVMNWKRQVVKTANRIIDLSTKMRAAATKAGQKAKENKESTKVAVIEVADTSKIKSSMNPASEPVKAAVAS